MVFIIVGVLAGVLGVMGAVVAFFLLRKQNVIMIKPWTTKSIGHLQDVDITGITFSLVTVMFYSLCKIPYSRLVSESTVLMTHEGVPKLKLSELETACEDFSNIIGSTSSNAAVYKGTLSTGTEIAVLSVAFGSLQDWSADLEMQFRQKVSTRTSFFGLLI